MRGAAVRSQVALPSSSGASASPRVRVDQMNAAADDDAELTDSDDAPRREPNHHHDGHHHGGVEDDCDDDDGEFDVDLGDEAVVPTAVARKRKLGDNTVDLTADHDSVADASASGHAVYLTDRDVLVPLPTREAAIARRAVATTIPWGMDNVLRRLPLVRLIVTACALPLAFVLLPPFVCPINRSIGILRRVSPDLCQTGTSAEIKRHLVQHRLGIGNVRIVFFLFICVLVILVRAEWCKDRRR